MIPTKAKKLRKWAGENPSEFRLLNPRQKRTVRRTLGLRPTYFKLHPSGMNRATRRRKEREERSNRNRWQIPEPHRRTPDSAGF